ncbi:MAG TPA: SDR family NAD(P)-dependent oxidoreductase [Amycolatopsis sp.]|jgi:deazaflavin-dependent oxidoreductase (nitroreductase family)
MRQTWFITGSSRGLGRALAQAALEAGDRVVATARRPDQLADLAASHGDRLLTLALDVTDPGAVHTAITAALAHFGRLDVVVNNAGYANVAPIETGDDRDFRAQFETDFWGVYHVSKAVIPHLRAQGGGTVVQFSSARGRVGGVPGLAAYQAAKFAVDGFSRVLAAETAPFGVRVLTVEPSYFATDANGSSRTIHDIPAEYDSTIGAMLERDGGSAGDPARAAAIVVRVVKRDTLPSHLLLGVNAVELSLDYSQRQIEQAREWEDVSRSAAFGAPCPAAFPPDLEAGERTGETVEFSPREHVRDQARKILETGTTAGIEILGSPIVLLTLRGAKTGKLRYTPVMRVEHEGRYAVIASQQGSSGHPTWYYNIKAHPEFSLQDGTVTKVFVAREAEGAERAEWWERAVAAYPSYAEYQEKADRQIPLLVLDPK